ncbi:fungal-specific transcription factor [Podospora aff. communis PSN243]|uniref:Fungal-specific transcription factor n=1 Tax=Podospora aff. communis PSN243 TaxID=3040156 RepID=A0AAV9GWC9_9PEZI|nr:fungal-specific transcription factor [Podospora aff. communis PSN243]
MSANKAPLACQNCRRLKRRCTRELPFCSLCVRLGKICNYIQRESRVPEITTGDSADGDTLWARVQRLEGVILGPPSSRSSTSPQSAVSGHFTPSLGFDGAASSNFPSSFFLDPDFFSALSGDALSSATLPLLSPCLEFLGMDLIPICHAYVATVNQWLPILSPKRLFHDIRTYTHSDPNPGLVLLLACIKLVSETEFLGNCPEYRLVKAMSSSAENEGIVSLRLIQSLLLLAAYEMGHGIYPAAYLTIGRAGRMAVLFGLQDRQVMPQLFKPADSWTVREEERRTWWGIFILDRFCHIATDSLPRTIHERPLGLSLPINDMGWSKGELDTAESSLVLSSLSADLETIGRFATTCQGSHLLCHVLTHRSAHKAAPPSQDDTILLDEALQLHRTLAALDERLPLDNAKEANIEALSLVCCARMILYGLYGCNEPDVRSSQERLRREIEMQRASVQGVMDLAAHRIPRLAQTIIELLSSGPPQSRGRDISLTVAHCLYNAATECAWFIREGCGPEMTAGLTVIVSALDQLRMSWAVSEQYFAFLAKEETVAKMFQLSRSPV